MSYALLGADGQPYASQVKGQWGGHRRGKVYGRLDCPSALRAIARGGYTAHRVFFADEGTAIAAGYRPCGVCCRDRYQSWKTARSGDDLSLGGSLPWQGRLPEGGARWHTTGSRRRVSGSLATGPRRR